MSELQRKYDETIKKENEISKRIKKLEDTEIIKEYQMLKQEKIQSNINIQNKLKLLAEECYDNCHHILIYSTNNYNIFDGDGYSSKACIKCGLDNSVLHKRTDLLSIKEDIMYAYLINHGLEGYNTNITCDANIAHAIYTRIKNRYPDIDDETLVKYFIVALNNMQYIPVSKERKENRIKRLFRK